MGRGGRRWIAKGGQGRGALGKTRLGRGGEMDLQTIEELLWGNREVETLAMGLEGEEP